MVYRPSSFKLNTICRVYFASNYWRSQKSQVRFSARAPFVVTLGKSHFRRSEFARLGTHLKKRWGGGMDLSDFFGIINLFTETGS